MSSISVARRVDRQGRGSRVQWEMFIPVLGAVFQGSLLCERKPKAVRSVVTRVVGLLTYCYTYRSVGDPPSSLPFHVSVLSALCTLDKRRPRVDALSLR